MLGVPYVLARGTEDVRAPIYRPKEYEVCLLEVWNVGFGELGKGSLCDISLHSRGATEADFEQVFAETLAKAPDSRTLSPIRISAGQRWATGVYMKMRWRRGQFSGGLLMIGWRR